MKPDRSLVNETGHLDLLTTGVQRDRGHQAVVINKFGARQLQMRNIYAPQPDFRLASTAFVHADSGADAV